MFLIGVWYSWFIVYFKMIRIAKILTFFFDSGIVVFLLKTCFFILYFMFLHFFIIIFILLLFISSSIFLTFFPWFPIFAKNTFFCSKVPTQGPLFATFRKTPKCYIGTGPLDLFKIPLFYSPFLDPFGLRTPGV